MCRSGFDFSHEYQDRCVFLPDGNVQHLTGEDIKAELKEVNFRMFMKGILEKIDHSFQEFKVDEKSGVLVGKEICLASFSDIKTKKPKMNKKSQVLSDVIGIYQVVAQRAGYKLHEIVKETGYRFAGGQVRYVQRYYARFSTPLCQ